MRVRLGGRPPHPGHEQQLLRRPVALQLPERSGAAGNLDGRAARDQATPRQAGDVVVSATGNQADDLSHPTQDATSPDDTSPVLREIHNQCAVVPVEVPGVLGVNANGNRAFKSFYSSYGVVRDRRRRPGRRLDSSTDGGRPERARPLDVARLAADRHLSTCKKGG